MLTNEELRRLADLPADGYATERSMARELLARREREREIREFIDANRYNTLLLASNPAQNAALYDLREIVERPYEEMTG